ncbi:TPA: hypothetical protein CPT87_05005 [Candidatus Gastranaerophilales bacterium HUM_5]|nr:MAG TPA: hypothetical protein CPT99_02045 [Candidatus Gastranaerophilales bacterium HUM_4]DAA90577.1 MAG TPA: hypothetical protein CPT87_05005 [Candidatus Gastranaerophilales bacterium HUM_5]
MARIRIIALKQNDYYINLYTSIVESDNFKKTQKLNIKETLTLENKEFIIVETFCNYKNLQNFKNLLLFKKELVFDNYKIIFKVEENIRTSFLLTKDDFKTNSREQVLSCFKNNCYLYENWCTDNNIKDIWLNLNEATREELSNKAEINLLYLIDRIGNILHFKEINDVAVSIFHQNDKFLTFSVSMKNRFIPDKYIAKIEVKSYDDIILKESFVINERFKDFELQDEDYNINIEIYEINTGECVFCNNFVFLKTISLNMSIPGREIIFRDEKGNKIHSIQEYGVRETSTVTTHEKSNIIQYQLAREKYVREYNKYKLLSTFKGFKGKLYKEAEKYFQELLKEIANTDSKYIYIADPYFLSAEFSIRRFINYMNIFATIQHKEVRILTCNKELPKSLKKFRKNNKNKIFSNIKIKSIIELSEKDKKELSSFHDRWIASDKSEYGFTNSLNNFEKGVSFFKSLKHYYEEAEYLWQISSDDENFIIQEFNLYE